MKLNRKELLEVLTKLRPVVAKESITGEQLNYFTFSGDHVFTYNDYLCVSHPFKDNFLDCSVPAAEFFDILKKIEEEEIDISPDKKNNLKIESKSIRANLKTIDGVDVILNLSDIKKWSKLPEDFVEGISICLFSVGKDDGLSYLTCLDVREDSVVSSDNYRISRFNLEGKIKNPFLLPGSSAKELIKYEIVKYYLGSSWVYFKTKDGVIICSRLVNEEYPDIGDYFDFKGKQTELPNDMKSSVEIASILAEGDFNIDKKIEVSIGGGKIKCKGENEIGWIEKTIPIESKVELKIFINPLFFGKILELSNYVKIGDGKALFKADKFEHLISLLPNE